MTFSYEDLQLFSVSRKSILEFHLEKIWLSVLSSSAGIEETNLVKSLARIVGGKHR